MTRTEFQLVHALGELRHAALELYMAGKWTCDRPVDEIGLWEALREALELPEGTATDAGVGA